MEGLLKSSFDPVGWGMYKLFRNYYFSTKETPPIKTSIKANGSDNNKCFAFTYLAYGYGSEGDNTRYEYGIVRIGQSGNNITKTIISKGSGSDVELDITFSATDDGYIEISQSTSYAVQVILAG